MKSNTYIFFLKLFFVVILISYLIFKISTSSILDSLHRIELTSPFFIVLVFFLMILNWGLESKKWQILIKDIQFLSFPNSFKSVLSGLSSGLLTPNRIGNFIGRLAYIKKEHHNQATVNTLVGNLAQFIATLVMGSIGLLFVLFYKYGLQNSNWILLLSVICIGLGCFLYFKPTAIIFSPINKWFGTKTKLSIQNINDSNSNLKTKVLALSIFRYFVFCSQYLLLFKAFGEETPSLILFSLIATVFLITTLIPSLLFGKLFVRESVAVFVFSLANIDLSLILIVAFLLWCINLAIPAIVGSLFWLKQNRYA